MIQAHEVAKRTETRIPTDKVFFKNVMVATDFSPVSDRALEFALSLARRYGSRIYLTHVITIDGYPMIAPELAASSFQKLHLAAEKSAGEILTSGRMNVPHEILIQTGNLWPTIEALIQEHKIDLLVVGTRGAGAVRKVLLGSGAEEIFRQAKIPVVTVGPSAKGERLYEVEFENILFATDFGKSAEREAGYAFSLAKEHGARLTFLHVLPQRKPYSGLAFTSEKETIKRQLEELLPTGSDLVCKLEFEVAVGEPVEEILRRAKDIKADLIVMGAKARGSLASNALHAKAYQVICRALCPVLTVKS